MWAPRQRSYYGRGWIEVADRAFRSDRVWIEVNGTRYASATVRFAVPNDPTIYNAVEAASYLRVFVCPIPPISPSSIPRKTPGHARGTAG